MSPVYGKINETAIQPYVKNQITQEVAFTRAVDPIREFMFKQTREKDIALFMEMSGKDRPTQLADIDTVDLFPAFVISELRTAFTMGFHHLYPILDHRSGDLECSPIHGYDDASAIAGLLTFQGAALCPGGWLVLNRKKPDAQFYALEGSMTESYVLSLAQNAVTVMLILAGPILLVSLIVGSLISLVQAATQINEVTLTFIPKIVAIGLVLALLGSWMLQRLLVFTSNIFTSLPNFVK